MQSQICLSLLATIVRRAQDAPTKICIWKQSSKTIDLSNWIYSYAIVTFAYVIFCWCWAARDDGWHVIWFPIESSVPAYILHLSVSLYCRLSVPQNLHISAESQFDDLFLHSENAMKLNTMLVARARTNCGSSTMNNNRESIKQKTKKKSLLEATLNLLKLQRLPTVTAIWAEQFFPVSHAVTKFKWIPGIQTTRVIARVQLSAHTICSCCQIATLTANKHTYKTQNTHYARSSNVSPKRCVDDDGWLTSTALRWIVVDNLNRSFHFFFVAVRLAACGRDSQQGSAAG